MRDAEPFTMEGAGFTITEAPITSTYVVGDQIGQGSYGVALAAVRIADGEHVVIKKIRIADMDEKARQEALQEVRLLSTFDHVNIVHYYECILEDGCLNIVMEYARCGDLSDVIQKRAAEKRALTEDEIMFWFVQIVLALFHVHSKQILHRDLKSQNIFIAEDNILKLGDFGIARVLNSDTELARTVIGTPYYLSPELCEDKPYNRKSDVWALGCVLYELATLKRAFDGQSLPALVVRILNGKYPPVPTKYSGNFRSLVDSMLKQNPKDRPSVDALLRLEFIRGHVQRYARHVLQLGAGRMQDLGVSLTPATATSAAANTAAVGNGSAGSKSGAPARNLAAKAARAKVSGAGIAAGAPAESPTPPKAQRRPPLTPQPAKSPLLNGAARKAAPSAAQSKASTPCSAKLSPAAGPSPTATGKAAAIGAALDCAAPAEEPRVGGGARLQSTWMDRQQAALLELENVLGGHKAQSNNASPSKASKQASPRPPTAPSSLSPTPASTTPSSPDLAHAATIRSKPHSRRGSDTGAASSVDSPAAAGLRIAAVAARLACATPGGSPAASLSVVPAPRMAAVGRAASGPSRRTSLSDCASAAGADVSTGTVGGGNVGGAGPAKGLLLELKLKRDAELEASKRAVEQLRDAKKRASERRSLETAAVIKERSVTRQKETEKQLADAQQEADKRARKAADLALQVQQREEARIREAEELQAQVRAHRDLLRAAKPRVSKAELARYGAQFAGHFEQPFGMAPGGQMLFIDPKSVESSPRTSINGQQFAHHAPLGGGAFPEAKKLKARPRSGSHSGGSSRAAAIHHLNRHQAQAPSSAMSTAIAGSEPPWRSRDRTQRTAGPSVEIYTPYGSELERQVHEASQQLQQQQQQAQGRMNLPLHQLPKRRSSSSGGFAEHPVVSPNGIAAPPPPPPPRHSQDWVAVAWLQRGHRELLQVLDQIQDVLEEETADLAAATDEATATATAAVAAASPFSTASHDGAAAGSSSNSGTTSASAGPAGGTVDKGRRTWELPSIPASPPRPPLFIAPRRTESKLVLPEEVIAGVGPTSLAVGSGQAVCSGLGGGTGVGGRAGCKPGDGNGASGVTGGGGGGGVAAAAAQRMEQLRVGLEQALGAERFMAAYRYLQGVQQRSGDEEEDSSINTQAALEGILGKQQIHLSRQIHKLLVLEDAVFA